MAACSTDTINTFLKHAHLAHKKLEKTRKTEQNIQARREIDDSIRKAREAPVQKKTHAKPKHVVSITKIQEEQSTPVSQKLNVSVKTVPEHKTCTKESVAQQLEMLEKKYIEMEQHISDKERLKKIKLRIDSMKIKLTGKNQTAGTIDPKLLHTEHKWLKEGLDEFYVPSLPNYPEEETVPPAGFKGYDSRFPVLEPPGPMPEMKERAEQLGPMPHLDTDYIEPIKSPEKEKKGILSRFFGRKNKK